jgi:hypothetical protein
MSVSQQFDDRGWVRGLVDGTEAPLARARRQCAADETVEVPTVERLSGNYASAMVEQVVG